MYNNDNKDSILKKKKKNKYRPMYYWGTTLLKQAVFVGKV